MTHPRCLARALPLALLTAVALAGGCKTDQTTAAARPTSEGAAARSAPAPAAPAARASTPPALPPPPAASADDDSRRDFRKRRDSMIDSDGDGVISDAERAAALRGRATAIHSRLDADGDGKLTPAELAGARGRMMRFDDPTALDTNHDGDISADELATAIQARRDERAGSAARDPAQP